MIIRGANIRRLGILAAVPAFVLLGLGCGGQTPEPRFPTPDPHALIPPPGPVTGSPDLSVWVPDGWRTPIDFDEASLEVSVAWANRGTAMAEDYAIVLISDGDVVYRWEKPLLAPGSERVEVLSLNDVPQLYTLFQGRHELELVLDPELAVPESDRGNNTFSLTRDFDFQLPDLKPGSPAGADWTGPVVIGGSDLVYGRDDGAADRGYYLAYGVTYEGAERAQSWPQQHSVEVNDYQINQWEFFYDVDPRLGPRNVQIHALPVWKIAVGGRPVLLGEQQFKINIDELNTVLESDEENNSFTGRVRLEPSRSRTIKDGPDDGSPTVHPVYALPADADDEQWDINGAIESMVHELFHAFGAVAPCATNYTSRGGPLNSAHVDDDPNDLMYSGDEFGIPIELDDGHDDYFEHDIPGCPDTADSPYLEPRP